MNEPLCLTTYTIQSPFTAFLFPFVVFFNPISEKIVSNFIFIPQTHTFHSKIASNKQINKIKLLKIIKIIFSTDSQTMIAFQTTKRDMKGEKSRFCLLVLTSLFNSEKVQCSRLPSCWPVQTLLRPSLILWNCSCTGKTLSSLTPHSDTWKLCFGPRCASRFLSSRFPLRFSIHFWLRSSLLRRRLSTTRSTFWWWWRSPTSWLFLVTHSSSLRPRHWRPFSVVLGCRPCCSVPAGLCWSAWWRILWSGATVQSLLWPSPQIWVFSSTSGRRLSKIPAYY